MPVDLGFAQWLRDGVRWAAVPDAAIAAAWEELARETEIRSCLATEAGAEAEGERQIAFLGGPLALDEHVIPGLRFDLYGRAVTLKNALLGYAEGVSCFVIGVAEAEAAEQTTLTVLRKLA